MFRRSLARFLGRWRLLLVLAVLLPLGCSDREATGPGGSSADASEDSATNLEAVRDSSGPAGVDGVLATQAGGEQLDDSAEPDSLHGEVGASRSGRGVELAESLERLGAMQHQAGEIAAAIVSYGEALEIYDKLGQDESEVRCHRWLGRLYRLTGSSDLAATHYRKAYELAGRAGQALDRGHAVNGWAVLQDQSGNLGESVAGFEEALAIFQLHGSPQNVALVRVNLAATLIQLGQNERALDLLSRAIQFYEAAGDAQGAVNAWSQVAWVHLLGGDLVDARQALERADSGNRGELAPAVRAGLAGRWGTLAIENGDFVEAARRYREAIQIAESTGLSQSLAYSWVNLCRVSVESRDPAVLSVCDEAVEMAETAESRAALASALLRRAEARRDTGSAELALTDIQRALVALEEIGFRVAGRQSRARFTAERASYFDLAVELGAETGRVWQALVAGDRLRTLGLAEALNQIRSPIGAGRNEEKRRLLLRMARLKEELGGLDGGSPRRAAKVQQLDEAYAAYEKLHGAAPEFYEERFAALGNLVYDEPGDWSGRFPDDPLVLVYYAGSRESYLWALDDSGVALYDLQVSKSELDDLTHKYLKLLSSEEAWIHDGYRAEMGRRLSDRLLGPVESHLKAGRRLIVVPDGEQRLVPFATLPEPGENGPEGVAYLVQGHEIVQAPSLGLLGALALRSKQLPNGGVAVISDPIYSAFDPRWPVDVPRPIEKERQLARLKASKRESDAIRSVFGKGGSIEFSGFDASAQRIVGGRLNLSPYAILHLAAHGTLDSHRPELSALELSRYDKSGIRENGSLRVGDIFLLDLDVQLVVAAACDTGLGGAYRSEALSAFGQAFMAAGADQVLVSHWSVDDQATSWLLAAFYRLLPKAEYRPGQALRLAQLEMLNSERFRRPYYWGAFVLQGDGSGLRLLAASEKSTTGL